MRNLRKEKRNERKEKGRKGEREKGINKELINK